MMRALVHLHRRDTRRDRSGRLRQHMQVHTPHDTIMAELGHTHLDEGLVVEDVPTLFVAQPTVLRNIFSQVQKAKPTLAKASSLKMCLVLGVSGMCSEKKSAVASASSKDTSFTPTAAGEGGERMVQ